MKHPAVFLDRDGTLIHEIPAEKSLRGAKVRFFSGVAAAVCELNKLGFLVILISNQPVVARGLASEREVEKLHTGMVLRLAKKGAKIDAVYFCPHHPNANLPKYRKNCLCRKPNIGMIKKAVKEFGIDLNKSFLVGDRTADIAAGNRAGIKMILVKTGYGGKDGKYEGRPDFVAKKLKEAVEMIKRISTDI